MDLKAVALGVCAVVAFVSPAPAHHSFAMFDAEQTVTLQGTVKEFEWTNPHSWLHIMATDTEQQGVWALELSSPARLKRMGMSADSVKPGDAICYALGSVSSSTPSLSRSTSRLRGGA